jgi:hypothetical protein
MQETILKIGRQYRSHPVCVEGEIFGIVFLKLHFLWRQPSVVSVGERKQECDVFVISHGSKKPLPTYELIAVHTRKSFY